MPYTSARAALRASLGTEAADGPTLGKNIVDDVDAKLLIWLTGTTAAKPASSLNGRIYYETDGDRISYDQGTTWRKILMQTADGKYTADATVNSSTGFQIAGTSIFASPTFTGTPAAPTAAPGTNTTQLATTAFVTAAVGVNTVFGRTGTVVAVTNDYTDAQVQNSPTNKLTTTGDVLYASAANTLARLGIGATAAALRVVGGLPSWKTPVASNFAPSDPAVISPPGGSQAAQMLGLGSTIAFTPAVSGSVLVVLSGYLAGNWTNDTVNARLRYGTGTAPVNTATGSPGTGIGGTQTYNSTAAGTSWCMTALITGLTVGTAYWLDVSWAYSNSQGGTTPGLGGITASVLEQ